MRSHVTERGIMSTESEQERRKLLDKAMNRRRVDLGLRWNEVADRAGMTYGNLHKIRSGATTLTDLAVRGIERALQWPPGSVEGILAGGDPTPLQMDKPPLTQEQQALRLIYLAWERDHGPEKALRMLHDEVDRLNTERARERPAG